MVPVASNDRRSPLRTVIPESTHGWAAPTVTVTFEASFDTA